MQSLQAPGSRRGLALALDARLLLAAVLLFPAVPGCASLERRPWTTVTASGGTREAVYVDARDNATRVGLEIGHGMILHAAIYPPLFLANYSGLDARVLLGVPLGERADPASPPVASGGTTALAHSRHDIVGRSDEWPGSRPRVELLTRSHKPLLKDFRNQHQSLVDRFQRYALRHMERDRRGPSLRSCDANRHPMRLVIATMRS